MEIRFSTSIRAVFYVQNLSMKPNWLRSTFFHIFLTCGLFWKYLIIEWGGVFQAMRNYKKIEEFSHGSAMMWNIKIAHCWKKHEYDNLNVMLIDMHFPPSCMVLDPSFCFHAIPLGGGFGRDFFMRKATAKVSRETLSVSDVAHLL